MGKRQRALLHEHIVALCAIIVAIMARQLSVLALALSQVNANRDREREGDGGGEKERGMGASSFGAVPHSERKPRTSANQHCQAQSTQSTQSTHTAAPQSLTWDKAQPTLHTLVATPVPALPTVTSIKSTWSVRLVTSHWGVGGAGVALTAYAEFSCFVTYSQHIKQFAFYAGQ